VSFVERQAAGRRSGRKGSRVYGVSKLRKTLNRIEKAEREAVKSVVVTSAKKIERDAISFAILKDVKDTGDMIRSIDTKFARDKLTAVIGPGAKSAIVRDNPFNTAGFAKIKRDSTRIKHKKAAYNFFKGYWHEFGTINHPDRPFMNPAWEVNKNLVRKNIRVAVSRALDRASRGVA
jgi:HK97 gp10 family phage protein